MKKLQHNISTEKINELVQVYYSLRSHVKKGELSFQNRMDTASDLVSRSSAEGIYFYRRTLGSSSPRSEVYDPILKGDRSVINLASNDYLNFSQNPEVIEESIRASGSYGIGSGSVPMLSGTLKIHRQLEERLAAFLGYEACLIFNSGYAANWGVFSTLINPGDIVIMDTLVHASIIDGCQNSSPLFFLHNDIDSLRRALIKARNHKNKLVVVDGVYSMDGDIAKLDSIVELTEEFGAHLAIDDAHGIGVLGNKGQGTQDYFNLVGKADLVTGSFGKALAGVGGFVCGKKEWIQLFELMSRPFLFSSSIPPSVAASLITQLNILESGQAPLKRLWENTRYLHNAFTALGLNLGKSETPIIPIIIKDETKVLDLCGRLHEKGVFVNPIIYPVVSKKNSRIRVSLTAGLERDELDYVLDSFRECALKAGVIN